MKRTGKTHGMRFKITPPRKAKEIKRRSLTKPAEEAPAMAAGNGPGSSVDLIGRSIAKQKNAVQLCQLGLEVHVSLQRDLDPTVHLLDRLRRGILDLVLIQGEELGVGGGMTGKGEGKTVGVAQKRPWRRTGSGSGKRLRKRSKSACRVGSAGPF